MGLLRLGASLGTATLHGVALSGVAALGVVAATHAAGAVATTGPAITLERPGAPGTACVSQADLAGVSAAGCPGVDLFGHARLTPGSSHTTTVIVRNTGQAALRSLVLSAGACVTTRAASAALCTALRVRITTVAADGSTTTPVRARPLARLHDAPVTLAAPGAPGEQETVRFVITMDRDASSAVMGVSVSQPITWRAMP